jgi:aldehyde dehydrogenase (NAD+)
VLSGEEVSAFDEASAAQDGSAGVEASEADVQRAVTKQRAYYAQGETHGLAFRLQQLARLQTALHAYEQQLMDALYADLGKSATESYLSELGLVYSELSLARKKLRRWAKPRKVKTALTHVFSRGVIRPEPYGTSLIIAPWNYPVQLTMLPLIGALAAGNTVIIKPSELAPHVSHVLSEMINTTYVPEYVLSLEGAAMTSTRLLAQPFDYVFFTGSTAVGKVVMEACARQLIPSTLELGGKSPCIVHHDANLALSAKRIAFGKWFNLGQTCVAPDYVLVQEDVYEAFVSELQTAIRTLYSDEPLALERYGKIINARHFHRLLGLMNEGTILYGGKSSATTWQIEPTLIGEVGWDAQVMQTEIFGPLLPILTYNNLPALIEMLHTKPQPLALYIFSESAAVQEQVMTELSFGGGCINDTLMHLASPYLPFGGVGASGNGRYHGEESFLTFSHQKSILKQTTKFDLPVRYLGDKSKVKLLKKLLK